MNKYFFSNIFCLIVLICLFMSGSVCAQTTSPGQALTGYGSSENYISEAYSSYELGVLEDGTQLFYYIPNTLKNVTSAPAVIFLHGMFATTPPFEAGNGYSEHLTHLLRQGYIVIYPQFNTNADVDQNLLLDRCVASTNTALTAIGSLAETDNLVLYGHSVGGILSVCWGGAGGVPVKALVTAQGNMNPCAGPMPAFVCPLITKLDYQTMAPSMTCPAILLWGDADTDFATYSQQLDAFNSLTNVSSKVIYIAQSDDYGDPDLIAGHGAPNPPVDTLDYRYYWAALDAALDGQTMVNFDMGFWSDDTPVKPVIESLAPGFDCLSGTDNDTDGVCIYADNCPDLSNPGQEDVDYDGIGDFCDPDTVYGTVTGDVREGVAVKLYNLNCGSNILTAETITDSEGYYSLGDALGGLETGRYFVAPDVSGYPPQGYWVDIPQAPIKSYDFYITTEYTVVCDPDTNLCWQDPQREAYNYADEGVRAFEANQYCNELILGGFDDWRVPAISELRSITAGFPGTETGGACPVNDGDITYAAAQNLNCFNIADGVTGNGPGDNGCYLKPGFTGTCDKPDPYSGGHPLEHVAMETPSDTDIWRSVLMFENGSVLFNHACTGVDVRCVRNDDGSPIVDCEESNPCDPGTIKSCECSGFGARPDGTQTCNEAGDCWGPCECTRSVIDTSINTECYAGDEFYDQAAILTANISLPQGDTINYDPAVVAAFLYECPDVGTAMPSRPPDGGSWENQIIDPGKPPYSIPIRGITYYRENLIEGRYCLLIQMSQQNIMPPIPKSGDYYYWDPTQGIDFSLDCGTITVDPQAVDVTLIRIGP